MTGSERTQTESIVFLAQTRHVCQKLGDSELAKKDIYYSSNALLEEKETSKWNI